MSALLHPMGPEPSSTYWVRRLALVAVAIVLSTIVISGVGALAGPGNGDAGSASGVPANDVTPTVQAERPMETATPGGAATRSGSTPGNTTSPGSAGVTSTASRSSTPASTPSSSKPTSCPLSKLVAKLKGDARPQAGQPVRFRLAVANTGDVACVVTLSAKNVELKVYSGTDRIWSTADCSKRVIDRTVTLPPGRGTGWSVSWDGQRSAAGCRNGASTPRPGTYYATFQLEGVAPVQQRMLLT